MQDRFEGMKDRVVPIGPILLNGRLEPAGHPAFLGAVLHFLRSSCIS